ncbi:MAG: ParA family protein [Elusimicrobia bacterium]|nr:ParA family protein [Elusimicrobiota bacterium]
MTEIIAIANQKGGVGKTTTAVNLAAALASLGFETLLIDTDPQGNATSGCGFDKAAFVPNLYNVLVELTPLEKTIKASTLPKLSVAGANSDLAGAEIQLVSALARESRLRGALPPVKSRFQYIILDCPPSLGLITINALNAADRVIVPIQGEYYAMEGLAQFVDAIQRVRAALNPKLELEGGVLTMFDSRMTLSNQVKDEVGKFFGERLFKTIIPRNIRIAEAPGFGQTIFQYDARSKGAEAYLNLAREFLARRGITVAPSMEAPKPAVHPLLADLDEVPATQAVQSLENRS